MCRLKYNCHWFTNRAVCHFDFKQLYQGSLLLLLYGLFIVQMQRECQAINRLEAVSYYKDYVGRFGCRRG